MTIVVLNEDIAAVARIDAIPTILEVICRTTGMGFAAVARVTEDSWVACGVRDEIAFGLKPGSELKVQTTICNEIRASGEAVIIENVEEDPIFRTHAVPTMYGFQSYISMPILRRSGEFFGTLCAIDPKPAHLNRPEIVGMFKLFAELIGFHLDSQERLETSQAALLDEQQAAELREQFIAVLGHDLRNPLASIAAGARVLGKDPSPERAASVVRLIHSSIHRMAGLIDNVLDFARGRLGGGLTLDLDAEVALEPVIEQVVEELRSVFPERLITSDIAPLGSVTCDRGRMAQLLSNLVANALTHGAVDHPVEVVAAREGNILTLSVANRGKPIPPAMIEHLFQPFFRAEASPSQQGLGLGLYIVSEIARAHRGKLDVASSEDETRFTLQMPAN